MFEGVCPRAAVSALPAPSVCAPPLPMPLSDWLPTPRSGYTSLVQQDMAEGRPEEGPGAEAKLLAAEGTADSAEPRRSLSGGASLSEMGLAVGDDSNRRAMRINAEKLGISEEDYSAQVATGKILTHLMNTNLNKCGLQMSIYDAAFVIPQICRSGTWPKSLDYLAARSYLFLFANFGLQLFILYMIAQEEQVMDKFAGQMYLCNFGANVYKCPDGPDCIGPGGTNYQNAGRMYDWESWVTRTFVRDSLLKLFPDQTDLIMESIDPGEYGLENYSVRFVCVFIFMMSVISDLRSTLDMVYILWFVPNKAEPWVQYEVPTWATKEQVKEILDLDELDFVKFRIRGIPLKWKILNLFTIILPKCFIWVMTAKNGVMFLMETAGIEDVIVNVTALTFILSLDEMLFHNFSHGALHHVLARLEPFVVEDAEDESLEQAYNNVLEDKKSSMLKFKLLPWPAIATLLLTFGFVGDYYYQHCQGNGKGGLLSQALSLPTSQTFPLGSFFFPWLSVDKESTHYWSPPE